MVGSATRDRSRREDEVDGEVLLIECGERATVNLTRADINPIAVDHLFITHLHWDHFADSMLQALAVASVYYGPRRGPQIWSKIISDAASQYDGPIVIGEDAMRFRIGE